MSREVQRVDFAEGFTRRFDSIYRSLKSIAESLQTIAGNTEKTETVVNYYADNQPYKIVQGTPTWGAIVESGSLNYNGVVYTVITQGDEGYIRVEAVPDPNYVPPGYFKDENDKLVEIESDRG